MTEFELPPFEPLDASRAEFLKHLLNEEETGWFVRAELGPDAWPQ